MATERRKIKKRSVLKDEMEKPTKEEFAVAKCLRFEAPSKEGKFNGNFCQYFIGSKIVDFLMESKWSSKKAKTNPLFNSRQSCVLFCARLFEKGFFHRVEKVDRREKTSSKKSAADKNSSKENTPGVTKRNKNRKDKNSSVTGKADASDQQSEAQQSDATRSVENNNESLKDENASEEKKKKRKPAKLRMCDDQFFIDGPDLFLWVYDPTPLKTYIIGTLLVIGSIAVCLFPLWPPQLKTGIYYLSLAAIGFIGVILVLCVIRLIVFVLAWLGTRGKVTLWILPNLTEDVGFFDSFKPLYTVERYDPTKKKVEDKTKKIKPRDEEAANTTKKHRKNEDSPGDVTVGAGADDDNDDDVALGGGGDDDYEDDNKVNKNENDVDVDDNGSYEIVNADDGGDDDGDGGGDDDDDDGDVGGDDDVDRDGGYGDGDDDEEDGECDEEEEEEDDEGNGGDDDGGEEEDVDDGGGDDDVNESKKVK